MFEEGVAQGEAAEMRARPVPEPFNREPWWQRFGFEVQAWLRQIAQFPGDPLPRLILADALEEADAPARAEFIRLQVQRLGTHLLSWDDDSSHTRRERRLLARHRAEWLQGLPKDLKWQFWGGLVEGVDIERAEELERAKQYLDVRRVLWRVNSRENLLTHLSLLSGVVALHLSGRRLEAAGVALLVHSPSVQDLGRAEPLGPSDQRVRSRHLGQLALSAKPLRPPSRQ